MHVKSMSVKSLGKDSGVASAKTDGTTGESSDISLHWNVNLSQSICRKSNYYFLLLNSLKPSQLCFKGFGSGMRE